MKLYVTAPFKGEENRLEIDHLCGLVKQSGFEDFCFIRDVENYQKIFNSPQELMLRAKQEIENCDALLIDLTNKSTGRAIETGIAFALNKKIIIIIKRGTSLKDTSKGIAEMIIEYNNIDDIVPELKKFFK